MSENDRVKARYNKLFPIGMPLLDIAIKLDSLDNDKDILDFRAIFCDEIIPAISSGYTEYRNLKVLSENSLVVAFSHCVKKLPKDFIGLLFYGWVNNNEYLKIDNHIVVIFNRYNFWKYSIDGTICLEKFHTREDAIVAAFEKLETLKRNSN